MKHGSTLFLKSVIFLLAIAVVLGMVILPQTEGRAANLDTISIYMDPLIIYSNIASIPFFIGLYQAFKLLRLVDTNNAFSKEGVATFKIMKFASLSLIGFILLALIYIRFFVQGEDSAGPTALGIIMSVTFGLIALITGIFQNIFQNAVGIKSENELIV